MSIPPKLLPWVEARSRFKLTHAEVQMARELGMNPKKLGGIANERQEPWKVPLKEFITNCYHKSYGRALPEHVRSIEELAKDVQKRRELKKTKKAALPKAPEQTSNVESTDSYATNSSTAA